MRPPLIRAVGLVLRVVAAVILLQTLYFKFTGAAESVYIFRTLGAEPWGRLGSGVMELGTAAALLAPATAALGGLLAVGVMTGAILSHLTVLGIDIQGDGGLLFALAILVWMSGAGTAWIYRDQLPLVGARLGTSGGRS